MPRWARRSSTSRKLRLNRKYSQTACAMMSAGNGIKGRRRRGSSKRVVGSRRPVPGHGTIGMRRATREGAGWGQSAHSRRDPTGNPRAGRVRRGDSGTGWGGPSDPRPSKPMIAGASSGNLAISFQDTSYAYLTCRRPKSGNIAFLSPHRPRIGPHAPEDLTTASLGFADRGSAGSLGLFIRPRSPHEGQ